MNIDVTSVGMAERFPKKAGSKPNVRATLSEITKFVCQVTRKWSLSLVRELSAALFKFDFFIPHVLQAPLLLGTCPIGGKPLSLLYWDLCRKLQFLYWQSIAYWFDFCNFLVDFPLSERATCRLISEPASDLPEREVRICG